MLLWSVFFAPEPSPPKVQEDTLVVKSPVQESSTPPDTFPHQTMNFLSSQDSLQSQDPFFSLLQSRRSDSLFLETGKHQFILHSKGGKLQPLYLTSYKTYDGRKLDLIPVNSDAHQLNFRFAHNGKLYDLSQFYFQLPAPHALQWQGDSLIVPLIAALNDSQRIQLNYTFYRNAYHLKLELQFIHFASLLDNNHYELIHLWDVPKTEKDAQQMRQKTSIYFYSGGEVDKLSENKSEAVEEVIQGKIKWISFKSHFFNITTIPQNPFESVVLYDEPYPGEDKNRVERLRFQASDQFQFSPEGNSTIAYTFYLGPNDYYVLKEYGNELESLVYLGGWPFKWINRYIVLPLFRFLEKYIPNYGIIILLLALFVKIILFPLTLKSYVSMAKIQIVNRLPEMKKIEEQFKDDPQTLQLKKMALYRQLGINPLGGCLPQLLQFPVLISLFLFFPSSIELRQKPFLWADDLSTYDSILNLPFSIPFYGDHVSLFTLLMTLTSILYIYMTQRNQGTSGPKEMRFFSYLMPILFLFFLNNYSAGLSFYYFCVNIITIFQTLIIQRWFIDEEEIIAKLRSRKKAKRKPSRWEEWVMKQQKQAEALRKRRK